MRNGGSGGGLIAGIIAVIGIVLFILSRGSASGFLHTIGTIILIVVIVAVVALVLLIIFAAFALKKWWILALIIPVIFREYQYVNMPKQKKLRFNRIFWAPELILVFALSVYCIYRGMNDPFLYFRF